MINTDFAGIICIEGDQSIGCHLRGDCIQGRGAELWVTDGTVGGTHRHDDINPGIAPSHPMHLKSFGDYLYFSAETPYEGCKIYH